jgi:hypothetical protein
VEVRPLVHDELRATDGVGVLGEHHLAERLHLAIEARRHADPIDQAVPLRRGRVEERADQIPFLRLTTSDESGETRRAAPPGCDVPVDLGHPPARTVGGDHEVADERQLEAASGADAVHGSDRHRRQILDDLHGLLVEPHLPVAVVALPLVEFLDVVARAEGPASTAQDHDPAFSVVAYLADRPIELGGELSIEGVVDLRAVERDRGDAPATVEEHLSVRGFGHEILLRLRW